MKTITILLLLLFSFVVLAQPKKTPLNARQLSMELRQKSYRISQSDLAAIKRILDKYPTKAGTNAPAKAK